MKKIIVAIIFLIILAGAIFIFYKNNAKNPEISGAQTKSTQIKIGSQTIKAEIVDNEETRAKGLSGRESLCEDCGMLFVFEKSDIYPFWMKEMKFPIDIIWLKDKKIVYLIKDAKTPKETGNTLSFTPTVEADLVLELNADFCEKNKVKVGDEIIIK